MYPAFKASVLNQPAILTVQGITNPYGVECVTLVWAYADKLFPGVSIKSSITVGNAAGLFVNASSTRFQKIINNHNDPNQVPLQGDIMVFSGTPAAGYTNRYNNPDGHTGICDSASSAGYGLLQQNAPTTNAAPNVTGYAWKFRPCIGWLRPIGTPAPAPQPPAPAPAPAPSGNVGKTLFLPPTTGPWHLYNNDGPYAPSQAKAILTPSAFGGLRYTIVADKGNGVYVINTQDFGQGALWTKGSDVTVS